MKKRITFALFLLLALCQLPVHGKTIQQTDSKTLSMKSVNLITAQELEIVCPVKPLNAQQVYDQFEITVAGKPADYTYLSYFDFGPYADAPVINLRLKEPLATGTLRGKTGNARTPNENTQAVAGPVAAASVKVHLKDQSMAAQWKPFYDYTNIGSKSKLAVTGTAACNTRAEHDTHQGIAYSNEHVIDYAAGGIHRMTGRAELITQNAVDQGLRIVLTGTAQSVYEAPEWRELFNPDDYQTRRVIAGTPEKPVIAATADDVMRQQSDGDMLRTQSDYFYLGEAFARLFWQVAVDGSEAGATLGCRRVPLSVYNDADDYRYDQHIAAAYADALKQNRYPGHRMMKSLEDYFVCGTMIFYEFMPESSDGKWHDEAGPVNTREELKAYDPALYRPLCGIFGEWEYFSSENHEGFDDGLDGVRSAMPWFWHTQADNYAPDTKAYAPLAVEHVHIIADNQIEIKFNREVKDMTALCNEENWKIQHSADQGATWTDVPHQITGSYLFRSITLQLPREAEFRFTKGSFGRTFRGFSSKDIAERSVAAGGWIDNDQAVSPTALEFGQYVGLEEAISDYGTAQNGLIRVQFLGNSPVADWNGNLLAANQPLTAEFKPWISQVYRSPLVGVYIYADANVPKDVLILSGMYYDLGFSNNRRHEYAAWPGGRPYTAAEKPAVSVYDRPGQRIADYATRQSGGMLIVGEGRHANQQPERRGQQSRAYHTGLYVGRCTIDAFGLLQTNILAKLKRCRADDLVVLDPAAGSNRTLGQVFRRKSSESATKTPFGK